MILLRSWDACVVLCLVVLLLLPLLTHNALLNTVV
jgi:hypothetical protein